jgi:alpha-ketoglutarate-dependent taurine dioxygenase
METLTLTYLDKLRYNDEPNYAEIFAKKLRQTKVLHYTGVPLDYDFKVFYTQLATAAGNFVKRDEDYKSGDQTEQQNDWLDITFEEDKKTASFRYSDTRQPLHTDGAYTNYHFDISFFFCTQYAEIGGATTFIDGEVLVDIMRKYEPQLLKDLEQKDIIFDKGENQKKIQKAIRYDEQGVLLNWNHFRISEQNTEEVVKMCDDFQYFLENKIVGGGLLTPIYLKTGEAAFFHDERILHGRNSFYGNRQLIKGGLNL